MKMNISKTKPKNRHGPQHFRQSLLQKMSRHFRQPWKQVIKQCLVLCRQPRICSTVIFEQLSNDAVRNCLKLQKNCLMSLRNLVQWDSTFTRFEFPLVEVSGSSTPTSSSTTVSFCVALEWTTGISTFVVPVQLLVSVSSVIPSRGTSLVPSGISPVACVIRLSGVSPSPRMYSATCNMWETIASAGSLLSSLSLSVLWVGPSSFPFVDRAGSWSWDVSSWFILWA